MKNSKIFVSLIVGTLMTPLLGFTQYFYDLKKEMTDFKQSFEGAVNRKNQEELASYFFEDAKQVSQTGEIAIGADHIVTEILRPLEGQNTTVNIEILRIHATDSLITVWGSFVFLPKDLKDEDEKLEFQDFEKDLLYTDEKWRIQRIRFTSN